MSNLYKITTFKNETYILDKEEIFELIDFYLKKTSLHNIFANEIQYGDQGVWVYKREYYTKKHPILDNIYCNEQKITYASAYATIRNIQGYVLDCEAFIEAYIQSREYGYKRKKKYWGKKCTTNGLWDYERLGKGWLKELSLIQDLENTHPQIKIRAKRKKELQTKIKNYYDDYRYRNTRMYKSWKNKKKKHQYK